MNSSVSVVRFGSFDEGSDMVIPPVYLICTIKELCIYYIRRMYLSEGIFCFVCAVIQLPVYKLAEQFPDISILFYLQPVPDCFCSGTTKTCLSAKMQCLANKEG